MQIFADWNCYGWLWPNWIAAGRLNFCLCTGPARQKKLIPNCTSKSRGVTGKKTITQKSLGSLWRLIIIIIIVLRALQISVSDYTYDDCRMISKAHGFYPPHASCIVEAHKLRYKLGSIAIVTRIFFSYVRLIRLELFFQDSWITKPRRISYGEKMAILVLSLR